MGVCPEPRINVFWLLFFKPDQVNAKDLPPDQTPKMSSNIYKAEVQVVYKDKILKNFRCLEIYSSYCNNWRS